MGRKPKNEFTEASLAFQEDTIIKKYNVKMPFLYALTVETNDPNIAKAQTTWEYFVKPVSNLDGVIKEIENNQSFKVKVIKVEPAVRELIDLCPRCHKRGVPKIEKKNTRDNRTRTWRNKEDTSTKKERPVEYWLTYTHSNHKKCRVCQYLNTPDPAYKKNGIAIEKYFFPYVIGNLKKGSFWYAD
ncbi:protein of unknown function [Nitrosotalea devaniterrae]|uniref:Uncharacterized protein n=1 Tax=Nitrosotalea devaniterrae TaxID=1078905 RepID=A0A128A115_9ARCH|nr:protein of unknown function [Candidatus Nitrosotalea devanaterra]